MRSSAWRGVLNCYFRSGNFEVLYTPINNYTNGCRGERARPGGRTRRSSQGPPTRASTSYPSQRRGCFYYAYSQVSAPPSRIIGTVGSKGGFVRTQRTTRSAKSEEATASSASMPPDIATAKIRNLPKFE